MARKRRGFGKLRKLPSGRWQASYTAPDTRRYNAPHTFQSAEDGEAWLAARRGEIVGDDWQPPRRDRDPLTLRRYADQWLQHRHKADGSPLAPRTRAEYRRLLDGKILPELGNLPLRKIHPETIDAWYIDLDDSTPTRKANAYGLLHAILATAVEQQRTTGVMLNPCQIRGAGRTPRASKTEPATLEELAVIVAEMPDRYQAMILLASWAALRFNELIGLRRRDIDVKAAVVHVRRGVNIVEGEWVVTGPKAGSIRSVAIPPHILDAVKHHLQEHVEAGRDALLFPAKSGGFMRESSLTRVFYPARASAGRSDLRFHDLRHSGLTYAARAGATTAELMARAGHKTAQAALIYQHASQQRDLDLATRLSELATEG